MHNLGGEGRDEGKVRDVMPESGMEVGVSWAGWQWGMACGMFHMKGWMERISKQVEE